MKTTTVRIEGETQEKLRRLAVVSGQSMQQVLAKAVESYRRQQIITESNARYAALRADPQAWNDMQREREEWDIALSDDLVAD